VVPVRRYDTSVRLAKGTVPGVPGYFVSASYDLVSVTFLKALLLTRTYPLLVGTIFEYVFVVVSA